ncbi:FAD:protein FMN transferase [Neisseria musculi]|uniref:FAD:protein FMN transferase n=1 Tax=Neisseria musculi TaxID=1815583 RepID=A0A7H1M8K0_9NEIS|nr:FAD:protein FMN transferase [Neisseria musculi]QNT57965.1 apbE family protein [Neisseria musculi]
MNTRMTRRRFIGITAAVAGTAAVPLLCRRTNVGALPEAAVWQGIALGAGAEMRLYHSDRRFAENLIGKAVAEISRLEKIFSLYRGDSVLVHLNQTGRLDNPPADLLAVLSLSRDIHTLTQGAFDPSIQPLWNAYAAHFSRHPLSESAPTAAVLEQALASVGFGAVEFDSRTVRFAKSGMALSFNGIAQGYITDRITEILRNAGLVQALVDLGEIRGLDGTRSRIWQAGIRHPDGGDAVLLNVPLQNQALSTSGGYGTTLDEAGRFTHLFNPLTGTSRPRYRSVSVTMATAATADALSTAFSVMDKTSVVAIANRVPHLKAWLFTTEGRLEKVDMNIAVAS